MYIVACEREGRYTVNDWVTHTDEFKVAFKVAAYELSVPRFSRHAS